MAEIDWKKMADEAVKYLTSPEGRKALEQAFDKAEKRCKELDETGKVTPADLRKEVRSKNSLETLSCFFYFVYPPSPHQP